MITDELIITPERLFKERAPFFHVCTKPIDGILFKDDEARRTVLLFLALAALESSSVLLAYAIMSNHVHVILAADDPERFCRCFIERSNAYMARHSHDGQRLPDNPTIVPITSLNQFMTAVAYVIRNQYVVDASVSPVSHIWCSGYLYFNPIVEELRQKLNYIPAESLSGRKVMKITHSKEPTLPPGGLKFLDEFPAPSSFVDYKLVERLFLNARSFMARVFRNVEGQVETALMLGETPVIPDEEMARLMWKYCSNEWNVRGFKDLSPAQRINLAKHMKYAYHSSNGQIARITGLARKEVDTFFPQPVGS